MARRDASDHAQRLRGAAGDGIGVGAAPGGAAEFLTPHQQLEAFMKLTTLGLVLTAGMIMVACAGTDPKIGAARPSRVQACALADTEADTCVNRGASGNSVQICHLYVGVLPSSDGAGDPYVYPHRLMVPGGGVANVKRRLVWHAASADLRFEVSDGPTELKNKPTEFPDGGPTKDIDGDQPGTVAARRYRIGNNYKLKQNKYTIKITQRLPNGTLKLHECDPFIINSDAN
jgi:hypothetical protein